MAVKQSRILIFGAGVIGSTYAVKFIKAGYQVTLLARSERLKTLRGNGLQYNEKDSIKCVKVAIIEKLEPDDIYDYIFVPVKYDQIDSALKALKDNQSRNIITMTNNPKGYADWENIVGKGRLLPAFPSAGGYIKNGILYSQFAPNVLRGTTFGEVNGQVTERVRALANLFKMAKIAYNISKNMDAYQKTHVAFDVAMTKYLYSREGVREQSIVTSKESIHTITLTMKKYLGSLEKAGIRITPSILKILLICPIWLMDFSIRRILKTKIVSKTLFGGNALDSMKETQLLELDFIDYLRHHNVVI
jgi:2-dehydropantoate 2-reductase